MMVNEEKAEEKGVDKTIAAKAIAGGDQPKTIDKIELANQAAKRMEDAADRFEAITKRAEEIHVNNVFGGQTSGAVQVEDAKEETPKEYMLRVMSGKL